MKPQTFPLKFTILLIILSFIFGIFGSIFSDKFVLPWMYSSFYNNNTNPRPVLEQTKMVEKISDSSIIETAKNVSPAVVSIIVTKELTYYYRNPYDFFFNDPFFNNPFFNNVPQQNQNQQPGVKKQTQVGGGTGFIVTSDGLVLTNKHVVDDQQADYTIITKDGTEYKAEVVTKDTLNDMAIIRMKTKDGKNVSNMPLVKFISDIKNIQVGQMVVAIGNALGEFENSITTGVISAKGREITASSGGFASTTTEVLKGLIQTDASINPGNSGGPLVDLDGEVLGMNTAIASNAQGIGFAIPLDEQMVNKILSQIQKYGRIVRPFLGVRYIMITPEINKESNLGTDKGSWIKSQDDLPAVVADTPAAIAGLKGGDIVLKVNGKELNDKYTLQDAVAEYNPNDVITLTILRDGKQQDIKVTLGENNAETTSKKVGE